MPETQGTPLDKEPFISLETFKKDGTGVKTPVWSAPLDGKLVIFTMGESYKVKRLRRNPKARAATCTGGGKVTGPFHDGTCRIIEDPAEGERALGALIRKYGWRMRIADFFSAISGRKKRRV